MEEKQKRVLLGSIGIIFLFVIALFVAQYAEINTEQPVVVSSSDGDIVQENKKVDKNNLLDKEVSLCGKIYKTSEAIVDGIDVVQKVASITTQNNSQHICENITGGDLKKTTLIVRVKQFPDNVDYKASDYYVYIGDLIFKVDTVFKKIYVLRGFDGEPIYIGKY